MAGRGGIWCREQSSFCGFKIKYLLIVKDPQFVTVGSKQLSYIAVDIFVAHNRIICPVLQQQLFIRLQERRGIQPPLVPDEHRPSIAFEDAPKFSLCFRSIEPVKRLARDYKIEAEVRQGRSFCRAFDT